MIKKGIITFILIILLNFLILSEKNIDYKSKEALFEADRYILFQRDTGGWPKNTDMTSDLSDMQLKLAKMSKKTTNDSTLDNDATTSQLNFLAKVYTATKKAKYKKAFLLGLDYLLKAQYDNGGWPQFYPLIGGYHDHITYNDDAMINVMKILKDISEGHPDFAFIDKNRKEKSIEALKKGIDCILKTQIKVNGELTAWCQQHDQKTLIPAWGREYEMISICSRESSSIISFLMSFDKPSSDIINAVQSAVKWFNETQIKGFRYAKVKDESIVRGFDRILVKDEKATPVWARMYEIGTNKPLFSDYTKKVVYNLNEIHYERRQGYNWYIEDPYILLTDLYPKWQSKWAKDNNVLK